jgi:predicted porin
MAAAIVHISPAAAEDAPVSPAAATNPVEDRLEVEIYGTLIPFFENVGTFGATNPVGFVPGTSLLASGAHTGFNHERRFRMTSGTSNIGFRGHVGLAGEHLELIWQVESPAPIDGEGPSNWANRNSHVGLSGSWGSLVYGNWDTPMRWVTVTSVNPIRGGYTGDMTPIIGTPGHSIPAWNSDQVFRALFEIRQNPVGFFRHEPNSVQYWSPTIAGFSARLMYSSNEHRLSASSDMPVPVNPYVLSGSIGYDNDWLRLRYSAEVHEDYFGTGAIGTDIAPDRTSSTDVGHLALASVKINAGSDYETRIVVTGDLLSYHTDVTPGVIGLTDEFSRAAFYALAQQTLGGHNIWVAYGQALPGSCAITGGIACTTVGLGAAYPSLGYMYNFTQETGIYGLGYLLFNDVSARYSPFPLLDAYPAAVNTLPNIGEIAAGSDSLGFGIGFVHQFSAKLLGGTGGEKRPEQTGASEREQLKAELKAEILAELRKESRQEAREEPPTESPEEDGE